MGRRSVLAPPHPHSRSGPSNSSGGVASFMPFLFFFPSLSVCSLRTKTLFDQVYIQSIGYLAYNLRIEQGVSSILRQASIACQPSAGSSSFGNQAHAFCRTGLHVVKTGRASTARFVGFDLVSLWPTPTPRPGCYRAILRSAGRSKMFPGSWDKWNHRTTLAMRLRN